MATTTRPRPNPTYRAKVTRRHTITLPADVLRQLEIAAGDAVEITVEGGEATLRKVANHPTPELRGLLADYFADREDVQRFIDEERSGWEE